MSHFSNFFFSPMGIEQGTIVSKRAVAMKQNFLKRYTPRVGKFVVSTGNAATC